MFEQWRTVSLLLRCRGCQQDVEAGFCDRNLICGTCRATRAVSCDLAVYERAWRKREHYRRAGVSLRSVDAQLVRLVVRMGDRMRGPLPNGEAHRALLNRLLGEQRKKVEAEDTHILLPS